jgi:hypothetical protein
MMGQNCRRRGSPTSSLSHDVRRLVGTHKVAIYRASHDDYQESIFPKGLTFGTCQDALDLACGLYLNDPTAWQDLRPPTN